MGKRSGLLARSMSQTRLVFQAYDSAERGQLVGCLCVTEAWEMAVMLIARFEGDVGELLQAYDRAHALVMSRGGATRFGELRHHCATSEDALYIIGVWESEEHVRARWASKEFEETLTSVGFPRPKTAELTILNLHATEPPLDQH